MYSYIDNYNQNVKMVFVYQSVSAPMQLILITIKIQDLVTLWSDRWWSYWMTKLRVKKLNCTGRFIRLGCREFDRMVVLQEG